MDTEKNNHAKRDLPLKEEKKGKHKRQQGLNNAIYKRKEMHTLHTLACKRNTDNKKSIIIELFFDHHFIFEHLESWNAHYRQVEPRKQKDRN